VFIKKYNLSNIIVITFISVLLIACSGSGDDPAAKTTDTGKKPTPLIPPTVVNIQSDTTKIILGWPQDTNVEYYELYWSTTSGTGLAGTKVTLKPGIHSYNHEFLEDGTTPLLKDTSYYYSVISVKGSKQSAATKEVTASLKNNPLPTKPLNLAVTNQTSSIKVSWDNDPAVDHYTVYWSTASGTGISGNTAVLPAGQTFFDHKFLADGTTAIATGTNYYYVVTAVTSIGESLSSAEVTGRLVAVTVAIPAAPKNPAVTNQTLSIMVSWDNDPAVEFYNVYWSTTSGAGITGNKVTLPIGQTFFRHEFVAGTTPLTPATDYYYVITAQNSNGESPASTQVTGRLIPVVVVPPTTPKNIIITPQNSQIQLQWDLDTTATGYNVYWSTTSGAGITGNKESVTTGSSYAHEFLTDGSGLSNGIIYYYVVTSLNATTESAPSKEFTSKLKNKPWLVPLLQSMMEP